MSARPSEASGVPPLTPEQIRTTTFTQSQLAWRGYSEDEVDAFLSRAADALDAAVHESAGLRREVDRLRNFYRDHGHEVDLQPTGGPGRRRGPDEGGLVARVRAYTDVQVERAKEYAALVDSDSADEANAVFHHASVQAALAIGESIRGSAAGRGAAVHDRGELDRVSLWIRAFMHALQAQLQVTYDAVVLASTRPPTPAGARAAHRTT